jgi:hypothetical protein
MRGLNVVYHNQREKSLILLIFTTVMPSGIPELMVLSEQLLVNKIGLIVENDT